MIYRLWNLIRRHPNAAIFCAGLFLTAAPNLAALAIVRLFDQFNPVFSGPVALDAMQSTMAPLNALTMICGLAGMGSMFFAAARATGRISIGSGNTDLR